MAKAVLNHPRVVAFVAKRRRRDGRMALGLGGDVAGASPVSSRVLSYFKSIQYDSKAV
jgi:hypothetical protein